MNYCFIFGHEPWLLPPALEMIDVIKKNGNSVDIIYAEYTGDNVTSEDYDHSNTFEIVKKGGKLRHYLKHFYLAACVHRLQKTKKLDVIIGCDILPLHALTSIKTKAKKGYWCFEEPHETKNKLSLDFYRKKKQGKWINSLSFLVMPSHSRKEHIVQKLSLTIPVIVIYNCKQLSERELHYHGKLPECEVLLIYTGKISPSQYINEIIDAIELVDQKVGLVLAGPADKEYLDSILNKINANENLKKRVLYVGRITRDEVYGLANIADIGFVLYGVDSEGNEIDPAPNKLGDYIAEKTWVIGSGQDYLKYWLDERGAGLTVREINKHTLADAIVKILQESRFSDKNILKKIYTDEFNMNAQYKKLDELINKL